ncbi:MAG: molecular chaperone HtpG [Ruminococcaceae bacterium]|nr:molecular chaperone HtpG [Oscillospiraceae bacterium]
MGKGKISVHTDNLLPIIKKWLYSDKDIFIRELVSNAQDAVSKLKKLSALGEATLSDGETFAIHVAVNKPAKTLTVSDNGIGMTEEEVEKYINQIAFSGAEEFMKRYEEEKDDQNRIIGHFGLGFYSAFMAAERVEIETLSYLPDATPVHWSSDGAVEYEITPGTRTERGTTITLHIAEDSTDYLEKHTVASVLGKYCRFLPVEIYLTDAEETVEPDENGEVPAQMPVNDTHPLWLKNPKDCTDEEYKDFYRKVFFDFNEPLFWIHLNVDFPFNLKGILYFPKLNHEFQTIEGQIKLYNNQVFIADNIKEVIPEYLMLLKGVIDCPDLPLNVSRSFLQNDGYVAKVSGHIVKKVSDKLNSLFKADRSAFEGYWDDINPFIKYGCMRDDKFYDRVKDILLFKKLDGSFVTLKEMQEQDKKEVYYVSDADAQAQYIALLKAEGEEPVLLNNMIDNHFISFLEYKINEVKFKRADAYVTGEAKEGDADKALAELFGACVPEGMKVEVQDLASDKVPAIITLPEEARRYEEMSRMFGQGGFTMPKTEETLVVNAKNALVQKISGVADEQTRDLICRQVYDIARLGHKDLSGDELTAFIQRSTEIMEKMI